jgi:hypothetical protein
VTHIGQKLALGLVGRLGLAGELHQVALGMVARAFVRRDGRQVGQHVGQVLVIGPRFAAGHADHPNRPAVGQADRSAGVETHRLRARHVRVVAKALVFERVRHPEQGVVVHHDLREGLVLTDLSVGPVRADAGVPATLGADHHHIA